MTRPIWHNIPQLQERGSRLYFDGCDINELADRFGTPTYVYSRRRIEDNAQRLLQAYRRHYPRFDLFYAVKANNHPAIVKILANQGVGADCAGVHEIAVAKRAGIQPHNMLFSGVYQSIKDMEAVVRQGIMLNVDDISQLLRLEGLAPLDSLCLRINPGKASSGQEGLVFAGPDAKFGICAEQAEEAYAIAKKFGVRRFGVHMMTGSNILSPAYFSAIVGHLLDIVGPIARKLDITFDFIDIGGSLGIPYRPHEEPLDINAVAEQVVTTFVDRVKEYGLGQPRLLQEPGRYLVGDAGLLLTGVAAVKRSKKTFIGIDAGMHTLLRPALYDAYHHIYYAKNLHAVCDQPVHVVGQVCENTDMLAKDRLLPAGIDVGDVLVLTDVGAYGHVMSSQYNTQPKSAEVLVCDGKAELITARETTEDLLRGREIPLSCLE